MPFTKEQMETLLSLVRETFPGWAGVDDPRFHKDETGYKRQASEVARAELSAAELERLIALEQYDEVMARLDRLVKMTNLLYRAVPTSGDAGVLYQPQLDKPSFSRSILDLIHGSGPSEERLARFVRYVEQQGLPQKWTFPTYLLFLCHPQTEMFVKPKTTQWLLEFVGRELKLGTTPTAAAYAAIKQVAAELLEAARPYGASDMIDVQSLAWVAARARAKTPSAEPPPVAPSDDETKPAPSPPPYSLEQCADDTGIDVETLRRWLGGLERKGQAVIYGPPGTGKTFAARHLARHLVDGTDGFRELVQFHPAYAYEDFVLGIRPTTTPDGGLSYPVLPGRFLQFCDRARRSSGPCVLIIDEINRANLSRVFGELMYLLEYRDESVPLSVDGSLFSIPANVRLIGTMNTADRSIALVDHALRRRFAFIPLRPNYDVLRRWHARHTGTATDGLVDVLRRINVQIADPNYEVGISFFLRHDLAAQLPDIWQMEIEPYLEELFFDQRSAAERFRWQEVAEIIRGQ